MQHERIGTIVISLTHADIFTTVHNRLATLSRRVGAMPDNQTDGTPQSTYLPSAQYGRRQHFPDTRNSAKRPENPTHPRSAHDGHHNQLRTPRQGLQPQPCAVRTATRIPPLHIRAAYGGNHRPVHRGKPTAQHRDRRLLIAPRPHPRDGGRHPDRAERIARRTRAGTARTAHRQTTHRSGQ